MTKKNILIVSAHPEPKSLTQQLVQVSIETLEKQGHTVVLSDLYRMRWKAVLDENDFPSRQNPDQLCVISESAHAYSSDRQTADVTGEQSKLLAADAVILQFPLWWFGVPAILKGWIERVYAFGFGYGFKDGSNKYRYGDGMLKGKRALVCVLTGGQSADYGNRGINGPIEQLLFPLTHGALFYPGMDVLPIHPVYGAAHIQSTGEAERVKEEWSQKVERLFDDNPIPFRPQNCGDYIERHTLASDVAPDRNGICAHIASPCNGY